MRCWASGRLRKIRRRREENAPPFARDRGAKRRPPKISRVKGAATRRGSGPFASGERRHAVPRFADGSGKKMAAREPPTGGRALESADRHEGRESSSWQALSRSPS